MKEQYNVLYAVYTSFVTKNCPNYFDNIYVPLETNGVHTRLSYQKLDVPHRKTNVGQKSLSYVGPSLWNNLKKTLKTSTSLKSFEHNIKQYYFNKMKKKESFLFVLLMLQSKYIHLNLTIYKYYFKIFSSLLFLQRLISFS